MIGRWLIEPAVMGLKFGIHNNGTYQQKVKARRGKRENLIIAK